MTAHKQGAQSGQDEERARSSAPRREVSQSICRQLAAQPKDGRELSHRVSLLNLGSIRVRRAIAGGKVAVIIDVMDMISLALLGRCALIPVKTVINGARGAGPLHHR